MKHLSIILTLLVLAYSSTSAQERRARANSGGERAKSSGQGRRSAYGSGSGEIQITTPADWIKNLENPIFSGPQPGERVPSFSATNLRGDSVGADLDPIALAKDKLHLLLFVNKSRTFGRFLGHLRQQLQSIEESSEHAWAMSVIVCTDDANEAEKSFSVLDRRYPKNLIVGLSTDGKAGPPAYGLDRNITATVIVAKDGKVSHNLPHVGDAFYSQPHILGAIAEAMDVDHDTLRKWIGAAPGDAGAAARYRRGTQENNENAAGTPKRGFRKQLAPLVQSGTITRAEAAELFRASGDASAFRTKIGELLRAGKLTRSQVGDLFSNAFPEKARRR